MKRPNQQRGQSYRERVYITTDGRFAIYEMINGKFVVCAKREPYPTEGASERVPETRDWQSISQFFDREDDAREWIRQANIAGLKKSPL